MKASMTTVAGLAAVLLIAGTGAAVQISTVPVGNPGNVDDNGGDFMGRVDYTFRMGKYEVSNAQYAEFLNTVDPGGIDLYDLYSTNMGQSASPHWGGITFTAGNSAGAKYAVIPGRGNTPVNYVNFWDACRFANWLHNGQGTGGTEYGAYTLTTAGMTANTIMRNQDWTWAICSEDEWYKAAYHKNEDAGGFYKYYRYPTSTSDSDGAVAEAPPGTDMARGSANYDSAVGDFTPCGAYGAKPSTSPYGTYDQAGNAVEWNETIQHGSYRGLRGGSFYSDRYVTSSSCGYNESPSREGNTLGFRVVAVPEPASMMVLAIGSIAVALRRRGPDRHNGKR